MRRGGAFGLAAAREPTLRVLVRWLLARGASAWLALALLLYGAVLLAFLGTSGGGGNSSGHQVAHTAAARAPETATLPAQEVAAINQLLAFTEAPPATSEVAEPTAPQHDAEDVSLEPAIAAMDIPTEPSPPLLPATQWSAAAMAQQAGRDALPQSLFAAVASALPIVTALDPKDQTAAALKAKATQDELVAAVITAALAPFSAKNRSEWTTDDHAKELQRLQILRDTAQAEVNRLQAILDSAKKLYAAEATEYESILANRAVDILKTAPRRVRPTLTCLGWKQTSGCGPYGMREPEQDKACNQLLMGGVSGYCELLDPDTNEHFRVMQLNCSSVRDHVAFSCTNAADFANFGLRSQEISDAAKAKPAESLQGSKGSGNGIVMVVYPKLMTSAYATIRVLRSFGCVLPIELWMLESEMARNPKKSDILREIQNAYGPVHVKTIKDPLVTGFTTKIHAIYNSDFENVLFLDADNVPVRDPTYLFTLAEFTRSSAMFWPDFWHPKKTIFNIHELSLLWQLVDMDFVDMFEQESGQILINRRKSAVAMEVLQFYAFHRPNHFDRLILAHGDKDLFRLAWLKAKTDFYMVPYPPGAAGTVRESKFCGMTMVQYDPSGEVLFLHRNAKKLNGRVNQLDDEFWTHMQTFDWNYVEPGMRELDEVSAPEMPSLSGATASPPMKMSYEDVKRMYSIGIQSSAPLFREFQSCYGAEPAAYPYFNLTSFEEQPFAGIEKQIIAYAHEAALLTRRDALLSRLDDRLARCLNAQLYHEALEVVKERVVANEFDRQRPLALAAFSNSSRTLDALAGAFAAALFADASGSGVQVLDLAQLLPSEVLPSTNRQVKTKLRAALAETLAACPERSLVVVENVQLLDDVTLPVLDTFLDPLNGERAHLQLHQPGGSSQLLDASGAVFLFLFKVERADFEAAPTSDSGGGGSARAPTWRDFLMSAWTRKEGLAEEFTPQAFVGRLTEGIALFANDEEAGVEVPLPRACRSHKPQVQSDSSSSNGSGGASEFLMMVAAGMLVVFTLLNVTKRWTRAVAVKSTRRGPIKFKKKHKRAGSSKKAKRF